MSHVGWLACVWGACFPLSLVAEKTAHPRIYTIADGLKESAASAVTLSPRGNAWIKHSEGDEISILDGYSVHRLPAPGRNIFRVHESRTGQLWSLYSEGLVIYDGTKWVHHPVEEIRREIEADPLRQVRQIPLIPAERDRVLFLLSSQLMEYDAARKRTTLLKDVRETGLVRFLEMSEQGDQHIWVTGAKGLAKVSGPLRRLNPQSAWAVHLTPDPMGVENLQRPFENEQGAVITMASVAGSVSKRVLLHFDGAAWRKFELGDENIRQAWPGWDGTTWAYTINSLLRFDHQPAFSMSRERIWLGQYKDMAADTNGVFWLATSEGAVRYAPYTWRTPPSLESVDSVIQAIFEDSDGRLWFGSSESLICLHDQEITTFAWPEDFEADFQTADGLMELPGGVIAIAAADTPLLFDLNARTFEPVVHPEGRIVRFIGPGRDGQIWAHTSAREGDSEGPAYLEWFDGRAFTRVVEAPANLTVGSLLYFVLDTGQGDTWFGGSSGLALYRDQEMRIFDAARGFFEDRFYCAVQIGPGRIWFGGADRVLELNGNKWTVIRSGLQRINYLIRSKDNRVWAATAGGVYGVRDDSWILNSVEEGLPTVSVSRILQDRQGRIWAGTARGLCVYHPDADAHPPRTLPPIQENTGKATEEGMASFVFDGMDKWDYTPRERMLFSYRTDESPWSPFTNVFFKTFEGLRPGKHRLEVRAMDRNWNIDPNIASLEFSIFLPWYKEKRLMGTLIVGLILVLFFAGLAVNRHLQLIRSYAEVERIVAVRTKELERANQELLHSHKMRALGTMAAGIAHDFNNILSIIKGSAQIIEAHPQDQERIHTRVSRIKTVVDQASGIVKSMLGLTRVTEQDLETCEINGTVENILKVLGDRFPDRLTVHFEPARGLPPILAVPELIRQMLLNLVLNAVDAMGGLGELTLKTGLLPELPGDLALLPTEGRTYVHIDVRDSGCGIDPEILPRIFEPFFTTKALSSRRGTGLGLTMVYELAKELGYGLRAQSKVGAGSTFTIIIPVRS